jgi:hypothetical protein
LNVVDEQLDGWRTSAGRAGTDTALKFVTSWYVTLDLAALETLRSGSAVLSDEPLIKKRKARAYEIAQYAPFHEFIPGLNDPEPPEEEGGEDAAKNGSNDELTMMSTRSSYSMFLPPRNPHQQIRQRRPPLSRPEPALFFISVSLSSKTQFLKSPKCRVEM